MENETKMTKREQKAVAALRARWGRTNDTDADCLAYLASQKQHAERIKSEIAARRRDLEPHRISRNDAETAAHLGLWR